MNSDIKNQTNDWDQLIARLREILIREIDIFLLGGGEIVTRVWGEGIGDRYSCALNAPIRNRGGSLGGVYALIAEFYHSEFGLELFSPDLWAFTAGFDGYNFIPSIFPSLERQKAFHDLGKELREKYLGKKEQ